MILATFSSSTGANFTGSGGCIRNEEDGAARCSGDSRIERETKVIVSTYSGTSGEGLDGRKGREQKTYHDGNRD